MEEKKIIEGIQHFCCYHESMPHGQGVLHECKKSKPVCPNCKVVYHPSDLHIKNCTPPAPEPGECDHPHCEAYGKCCHDKPRCAIEDKIKEIAVKARYVGDMPHDRCIEDLRALVALVRAEAK